MIFDARMLQCPYCMSSFEIELDPTEASDQHLIIDCEVCCRPIELHAVWNYEGELSLNTSRDDSIS